MCDPVTLTVASVLGTSTAGAALTVAGLGLGVLGGIQQANAARADGKYQQQVANNNAILAEQNATDAYRRGALEEEKHRATVRRAIGSQRAALAANGLDLGTGTPVDLVTESAKFGEMDALTIRANAAREAWGFQSSAEQYRADGRAARASGNNAANGTLLTTGASLFGGVANAGFFSAGRTNVAGAGAYSSTKATGSKTYGKGY